MGNREVRATEVRATRQKCEGNTREELWQHNREVGKLEVAVTEEYLQELYEKQGGRDFYTGLEIPKLEDISVDRINNELGYIEGNLVLTTKEINMFRRDRSVDKFIELCSQVANHFNNK